MQVRRKTIYNALQLEQKEAVVTPNGREQLRKGDWVVTEPGCWQPLAYTDDSFRSMFEPVEEEPEAYVPPAFEPVPEPDPEPLMIPAPAAWQHDGDSDEDEDDDPGF